VRTDPALRLWPCEPSGSKRKLKLTSTFFPLAAVTSQDRKGDLEEALAALNRKNVELQEAVSTAELDRQYCIADRRENYTRSRQSMEPKTETLHPLTSLRWRLATMAGGTASAGLHSVATVLTTEQPSIAPREGVMWAPATPAINRKTYERIPHVAEALGDGDNDVTYTDI
jgi:hypothetical protein